jgi:prophage regulatory protein
MIRPTSGAAMSAFTRPMADPEDRLDQPERLISFATIRDLVGLSRSTIWRLVRVGAFPPSIQISPGRRAWREADVRRWIESKIAGVGR